MAVNFRKKKACREGKIASFVQCTGNGNNGAM
jgi:hypothetical protein